MSTPLAVLLVLAMIPAAVAVFGNDPRGLLALALCLGALFLLHQHRARLGEVPMAVTVTKPVAEQRTSPPAWDPLGAAPFAWDLPKPGPAPGPPPPQRPGSRLTPVTLGLALLAAGIAAAVGGPVIVVAVALAVVGLGLLVGSVLHRVRGLLVAAIPLALATWVLHAVPLDRFSARVSGDGARPSRTRT